MENHIIKLLENNVRVVLPDLGAFIVKQKKPLKIIFNEFLKYNDGLLIEYVSKSDNIGKEEATTKITEYISGVKEKLGNNQNVTIAGLGLLSKDASGNIAFDLEGEEKVKDGTAAAKADKKVEKKSDVNKEEATVKTKMEEAKAPVKEEKKPEPVVPPKTSSPVAPKQPIPSQPPQDPIRTQASSARPVEPSFRSKYAKGNNDDEKKSTWLWIVLALVAIIIVVLTVYITGMSSDKKTEAAPIETPTQEETPEVIRDEPEEEIMVEPESVMPIVTKSGKRYYVIAGCFKVPGNATRYVESLRKKGYPAENLGIINGYHVVSFNSFATKSEALRELENIRNDFEAEAWLKKY